MTFSDNLHAHVATASSDCDGPFYRDYVMTMNNDETAEQQQEFNDFSDIHFMERVLTSVTSVYSVEYEATIKITKHGFDWHEQTDEGYRSAEVRWCDDECDESAYSQRDVYAEQMGY